MLSPFDVHPTDAVLDDDGEFERERRVVGETVRHRQREHVAVAVLVLEAFAGQRRAAGGAAEQEPARAAVGSRPDQVADPLESEHRIEDEERDRVDTVASHRRCPAAMNDDSDPASLIPSSRI